MSKMSHEGDETVYNDHKTGVGDKMSEMSNKGDETVYKDHKTKPCGESMTYTESREEEMITLHETSPDAVKETKDDLPPIGSMHLQQSDQETTNEQYHQESENFTNDRQTTEVETVGVKPEETEEARLTLQIEAFYTRVKGILEWTREFTSINEKKPSSNAETVGLHIDFQNFLISVIDKYKQTYEDLEKAYEMLKDNIREESVKEKYKLLRSQWENLVSIARKKSEKLESIRDAICKFDKLKAGFTQEIKVIKENPYLNDYIGKEKELYNYLGKLEQASNELREKLADAGAEGETCENVTQDVKQQKELFKNAVDLPVTKVMMKDNNGHDLVICKFPYENIEVEMSYELASTLSGFQIKNMMHEILSYGIRSRNRYLYKGGNFIVQYDSQKKRPELVFELLTPENLKGTAKRNSKTSKYRRDQGIPDKFSAHSKDFECPSDYNRGHMAPAADNKATQQQMDVTFWYSNIIMECKDENINQKWTSSEQKCRDLTNVYPFVHVITGVIDVPQDATGEKVNEKVMSQKVVGQSEVYVSTHKFKIVLAENKDIKPLGIGLVIVPNTDGANMSPFKSSDTLELIERVESYLGFEILPDLRKNKTIVTKKLFDM